MTQIHASAVLFTNDKESLARFYERVAALRQSRADDDHIALVNDGFRLIVHRIPEPHPGSTTTSKPPQVRVGGAIKLSLPVESIAASRQTAAQLGGGVEAPDREWLYESTTVCDGWDPDGNVFQLFQPLAP